MPRSMPIAGECDIFQLEIREIPTPLTFERFYLIGLSQSIDLRNTSLLLRIVWERSRFECGFSRFSDALYRPESFWKIIVWYEVRFESDSTKKLQENGIFLDS